MSYLLRARDLVGRPVVTVGGDEVGEVKDIVLGLDQACLVGFTLRNPGFLGGPQKRSLPWGEVRAVGPDAVMIDGEEAVARTDDIPADGSPVVDLPVMSEGGDNLGRVVDVVLSTGSPAQVVGFELEAGPGMPGRTNNLLLPVDEMLAVSEQALVVPEEARRFVRDDLSGFGAAVDEYRGSLQGGDHAAS